MTPRRTSGQPSITVGQTIAQIHSIAGLANLAVKNADDARNHLFTKGWITPRETIALEVLARVLFATVVDTSKLPQTASMAIASVAYLLTEKLETGILENATNHLTLHIKDTLDSITSDLHVKLDQHIQNIAEAAQKQTDLTDKLTKTQEKLEETTQKAATTTRTYSQVAVAPPTLTLLRFDHVALQKHKNIDI